MTGRRTPALLMAGAAALLVLVVLVALALRDDEPEGVDLTVGWGESPACVYDEAAGTVSATITVTGSAPDGTEVEIEVATYADENTSQEVGRGSETIEVSGTVDEEVVVSMPVSDDPFVDIDGVTACSLEADF